MHTDALPASAAPDAPWEAVWAPPAVGGPLTFHDHSCSKCGSQERLIRISEFGKAVCEACYPEFFRRRVEATVRRFRLVPRRSRVAVALSGGKDSGAVLDALARTRARLNFTLTALHLDMGLGDYSDASLRVAQEQCRAVGVPLATESVAGYGVRVEPVRGWPTCAVCGIVRRAVLPRMAREVGAAVLVTGHTLDDQLQYMLKNLLCGRLESPAPLLPAATGQPAKAKPLIQIPDAATREYVRLRGLPTVPRACPSFAPESHRFKEVFEVLERHAPMGKLQLWQALRRVMKPSRPEASREHACPECGETTWMPVCPLCRLRAAQEGRSAVAVPCAAHTQGTGELS